MSEKSSPKLISQTKENYGDSFKADLFEQYKLYVASAEKISEWRVSSNNYLLTVNTLLVTLYGLLPKATSTGYWAILVPIAGILVAFTWYRIITSYRDLNGVKYRVIHELEKHMPAELYAYEWKKAEEGKGKAYHPLTHLERWIPVVFMILYVGLGIFGGYQLFK
ncbi:MAG: hypothetical protein JXA30_15075 [Deltaproteobacteria bacterium]|nr:hypothetical protein [Deltaproteobacteria bacterium]